MRVLPKVLNIDKFTMTQVMREDDLAIYRQTKNINGRTIERFEVIVIRVRPERWIFGKTIPAHEKYPSSEDWGTYGWTCLDMDDAWVRVKKIFTAREEAAALETAARKKKEA